MKPLTRRAALAAAASVPALALPAVALAAALEPRDDAVYAAIERHWQALKVWQDAYDRIDPRAYDPECRDEAAIASMRAADRVEVVEEEIFEALLATVPVTRAGAFASAKYVSECAGACIMPSHRAYVAMLLKSPLVVQ